VPRRLRTRKLTGQTRSGRRPISPREPVWARWPDERLLDLRLCDLDADLDLEAPPLARPLARLHDELAGRGLTFGPHCWLSEEWFAADGIPGFAVPFYLAHPRLRRLERRQMHEVVGGSATWCMKLLRHEAGHAIDAAYRLRYRRDWQSVFGDPRRRYPTSYRPQPDSRSHVLHLRNWYAQSHPCEDFAETLAVWLGSGSAWKRRYRGWPALEKLTFVDALMAEVAGRPAILRSRGRLAPLARLRETLRAYYRRRTAFWARESLAYADEALARLFPDARADGAGRPVADLIRALRPGLARAPAFACFEQRYLLEQLLQDLSRRARETAARVEPTPARAIIPQAMRVLVPLADRLSERFRRVLV